MGQEILYTSAPQGLRQGSSGFCTVGSTAGMEPNLAEFLEGFSGYPHPFKPPDPRTKDNPINYSFIQWTIGGQRYYVLSRVCDAGLDHTGRTNLLAHHVALTRREIDRCPGGPAHVMLAGDFFLTDWNKQLKTLAGQKPRAGEMTLQKCVAWEQAAGDAGYAGVLAEAAKEKGGKPVNVIYPAGLDVLPLIAEAQSLLPADRRWNVTFATLYSRIYTSFDVQWRFLFHETTEAKQARRDSHAVVIDLCHGPLPQAVGGELVTAAREGRLAQRAAAPTVTPAALLPGRRGRPTAPKAAGCTLDDPRLAPPEVLGETLPAAAAAKINPFQRSRQRSVWLHYTLAGIGGAVLAAIAFLLLVVFGPGPEPTIANLPPANSSGANKSAQPTPETPAPVAPTDVSPPPEVGPTIETPRDDNPPPPAPIEPITSSIPSSPPMPPPVAAPPRDAMEDIVRNKQQKLPLPLRQGAGGLSGGNVVSGTSHLANVYVQSAAECALQLVGKEAVFGLDAALIRMEPEDQGPVRTWRVIKLPAGALGKREEIGSFKLQAQKLSFDWNKSLPPGSKTDALRHCLLEVNIGGDKRICRLSAPTEMEAVKLAGLPSVPVIDLSALDSGVLSGSETLKLEVRLVDVPAPYERIPDGPLAAGSEQRVLIKGGTNEDGPRIELTVRFGNDPSRMQRRTLGVTAKVTYRWPDVGEEDAMKAVGSPFDMKLIQAQIKDVADRVEQRKTAMKRQEGKLDDAAKAFNRRDKEFVQQLLVRRAAAAQAQGDLKNEIKKEVESIEKRKEALMQEWDVERTKLHDDLTMLQQSRDDFQKVVQRQQDVQKLMTDVAAKGRLEFRVYFQIEGEIVELYRSKGFPREL